VVFNVPMKGWIVGGIELVAANLLSLDDEEVRVLHDLDVAFVVQHDPLEDMDVGALRERDAAADDSGATVWTQPEVHRVELGVG
jgi:hypothetical protein